MSILNEVDDIKIGINPVKYVYLGDKYIWLPTGSGFWTFEENHQPFLLRLDYLELVIIQ